MKTRKQAAQEICALYNAMEVRKVKLETIYRKMYRDRVTGNFRVCGRGYDYTA